MKLEKLLNDLISLGWKPRGDGYFKIETGIDCVIVFEDTYEQAGICSIDYSLNDLCSIDSGLRQFVCENDLYNSNGNYDDDYEITNTFLDTKVDCLVNDTYQKNHYRYWIMLSSIQDSKEQFLLDNISLGQTQQTS